MRDEFLITRQNRQYVLFQGLLDEAHSRGLAGIDTELLQVPGPDNGNVAIVKAIVRMEEGRKFSGIGDASPENVGRTIAPHLIRMAETRAKARALRDAVNVGALPFEDLLEGDGAPPAEASGPRGGTRTLPRPTPIRDASAAAEGGHEGGGQRRAGRAGAKARKSQVDLLRTLAVEWAGEGGVERLEARIGHPIKDLTREQA